MSAQKPKNKPEKGKYNYTYTCPVRGEFESPSKEEKFVIECLNWLIKKRKTPINHIEVDQILAQFGAGGRNSIRPDIIVFNCPKERARDKKGNIKKEKVSLLAEIKVAPKHKASAIQYQLLPAMKLCDNVVGGIYWDSATRAYIDKQGKEHSITSLPLDFIHGGEEESKITLDSLMPIDRGYAIWNELEQALRNSQGMSKGQVYEDLFKILISKYYDESKDVNEELRFGIFNENEKLVFERISELYDEANRVYKLGTNFFPENQIHIKLSPKSVYECVRILEGYSLRKTDRAIVQEFYMQFAPQFLKKDLAQYYTPREIVDFMVENVKLKNNTLAIDPCCGTGDFMVGLLRRGHKEGIGREIEKGLHCWDLSAEAAKLAQINMILNGDGRTNIKDMDSLDKIDEDNNRYDFVITNPPFGRDTLYEGESLQDYELAEKSIKEKGKLFIERGLKLLNNNGYLISIIPTGYLENPSDVDFREIILRTSRLIGCVSLPSGVFKQTGTDVPTSILMLKKCTPPEDYRIFAAVAENVGFDVRKKGHQPLWERREEDGAFILEEDNKHKIKNDLVGISQKLRAFAEAEKLDRFVLPNEESNVQYSYTSLKDIKKDGYRVMARVHDESTGYRGIVDEIKKGQYIYTISRKTTSRRDYFLLKDKDVEISNNDTLTKDNEQVYRYIDTGSVYKNQLKDVQELRGWELPDRAKLMVEEDYILIAKMRGSASNFLYCTSAHRGFLASNGFYKVRIQNERKRLSLFRFLFTEEYKLQAKSIATGTIMPDVKEDDFRNMIYIPLLDAGEVKQAKDYLESVKKHTELGFA